MNNLEFAEIVVSDIRSFYIMDKNDNYKNRLKEAYNYLKEVGVTSLEDFLNRKGLKDGAFTYDEITIFDRINDKKFVYGKNRFNLSRKNSIKYIKN